MARFEDFASRSMGYKRLLDDRFIFQNDKEGYFTKRIGNVYQIIGHWVYE